jgi:TatD DNase family protein
MKLHYFDIHTHLDFPQYDKDREEVIAQMKEEGIYAINVGVDRKTSEASVHLALKHENIYACLGVHPTDNPEDWQEEYFEDLLNSSKKIVGVGECGLDYFRTTGEGQKTLFQKQLDFALKHDLPVMFHFRPSRGSMDAYLEGLEILSLEKYKGKIKGNAHFFVGDLEVAKKFLALGHTVSFDGPITFSGDYHEVIKETPLESIMAETDSPFASPAPYRGVRNSPLYVKEIYQEIARIKGLEREEVRLALNKNALKFWGISIT